MRKKLMFLPLIIFITSISLGFNTASKISEPDIPVFSPSNVQEAQNPTAAFDGPTIEEEMIFKLKTRPHVYIPPKEDPPPAEPGKVIYLTIDDGPSRVITDKMLDVLKKYDVKATFFVIGGSIIGNESVLKRIHDEGHSIGVHSYTHDSYIYKNQDDFVNEMIKTSDLIEKITGIKAVPLRFPGGSLNHLDKQLLDRLHGLGYKVFDWTISAGDGMYPHNEPHQIFLNATDPQYISNRAILLMHTKPNNANSIEALPMIIEYYQKNGYRFEPMTDSTQEYHFKF